MSLYCVCERIQAGLILVKLYTHHVFVLLVLKGLFQSVDPDIKMHSISSVTTQQHYDLLLHSFDYIARKPQSKLCMFALCKCSAN